MLTPQRSPAAALFTLALWVGLGFIVRGALLSVLAIKLRAVGR